MILADDIPGVYFVDYIPEKFIAPGIDGPEAAREMDVFEFLFRCCGERVIETCLSHIHVVPPPKEVAEALRVPRACGLLLFEEVNYDVRTEPLICCEEYFVEGAIDHAFIRKLIR